MPTAERTRKSPEQTNDVQLRKKRYSENKKRTEQEEKNKRKEEIKDKQILNRRLSFLTNLIYSNGYDMKRIAQKIGTTQQALSWNFSVKDNCRLSLAQKIVDALGYSLHVKLKHDKDLRKPTVKEISGTNDGVRFVMEGNATQEIRAVNPKMPYYVNECTPDKRMHWLAEYLPTLATPITELCKSCEMDLSSLRYIFVKDDIKISQIFQIAKATGAEISWIINHKQNTQR